MTKAELLMTKFMPDTFVKETRERKKNSRENGGMTWRFFHLETQWFQEKSWRWLGF